MTNILRYALSVILPTGYLIWLAIILSHNPSSEKILNTVGLVLGFAWVTKIAMPPVNKGMWSWICRIPALLMVISWAWFYFRLSPIDERPSMLAWMLVVFGFGGGIALCDMAYRKWWLSHPMLPKVFLATMGIIISGGAVLYLLSVLLKGVNWHDVLITNWYVTVLVLYLPVFLGILFLRRTLENRKTERKP
jgi:hypothetical protein